jgi:hypothetical protein
MTDAPHASDPPELRVVCIPDSERQRASDGDHDAVQVESIVDSAACTASSVPSTPLLCTSAYVQPACLPSIAAESRTHLIANEEGMSSPVICEPLLCELCQQATPAAPIMQRRHRRHHGCSIDGGPVHPVGICLESRARCQKMVKQTGSRENGVAGEAGDSKGDSSDQSRGDNCGKIRANMPGCACDGQESAREGSVWHLSCQCMRLNVLRHRAFLCISLLLRMPCPRVSSPDTWALSQRETSLVEHATNSQVSLSRERSCGFWHYMASERMLHTSGVACGASSNAYVKQSPWISLMLLISCVCPLPIPVAPQLRIQIVVATQET